MPGNKIFYLSIYLSKYITDQNKWTRFQKDAQTAFLQTELLLFAPTTIHEIDTYTECLMQLIDKHVSNTVKSTNNDTPSDAKQNLSYKNRHTNRNAICIAKYHTKTDEK